MVKEMIKKIIILFGLIFSMAVSVSTISANTTSVKVEVMSRNIEKHTINVKTDDDNADKFTLRKVSAAQMDVANKGSIVKVTYDDNFNISSLEKIKSKDNTENVSDSLNTIAIICIVFLFLFLFTMAIFL